MSIQEKLTTISENVPRVYESGVAEGRTQEWSDFWDATQKNGTRTTYYYAFSGYQYNFDTFYPKYDIRPQGGANNMFYNWSNDVLDNQVGGSLKARLEECGVVLDTSRVTNITSAFGYSHFSEIPIIDCTGLTVACSGVFNGAGEELTTIEKIIVNESVSFINWFASCRGLVNLTFEGVIGQDSLNLAWSKKLNKASITSVVNALSTTTSGLSVAISKTAVKTAFNTTDPSTCEEWLALRNTRSNWIINLSDK